MDLCQRTKELWAAYLADCNAGSFDELTGIAPDCSIIGTGKHEIYRDLEQFSQAMRRDLQDQNDLQFHFRDFWCTEQVVDEQCSLVYGGLSIGASPIHSGDCLKTAFKRADQALYQAKAAGKNQGRIL